MAQLLAFRLSVWCLDAYVTGCLGTSDWVTGCLGNWVTGSL